MDAIEAMFRREIPYGSPGELGEACWVYLMHVAPPERLWVLRRVLHCAMEAPLLFSYGELWESKWWQEWLAKGVTGVEQEFRVQALEVSIASIVQRIESVADIDTGLMALLGMLTHESETVGSVLFGIVIFHSKIPLRAQGLPVVPGIFLSDHLFLDAWAREYTLLTHFYEVVSGDTQEWSQIVNFLLADMEPADRYRLLYLWSADHSEGIEVVDEEE